MSMSTSKGWPRGLTPDEQRQWAEAQEAYLAKIKRDKEAEKTTSPADKFRAAVQTARERFLSGPLDIVAELVEHAADSAKEIADPRAPKLKKLANQLDAMRVAYDRAEEKLWALFGHESNAMEPAPREDYDVTFDDELAMEGERLIWIEEAAAYRLEATRRPGESYSELILRLVESVRAGGI